MLDINETYSMLDFELIGKNIKIDFSKHLTKKEKSLFRYLKIQKYNHISLKKICELCSFCNIDEIIKFLNNLRGKTISLSAPEINYYIYLSIIQSFYINNNIVYIVFSDEISSAFKKGSFFQLLGLDNTLFLEEKFSYRIYHHICNINDKEIFLSIDELRNILEIGDSYKRFFDLEKNFLIPIFEDIRKNTHSNFSYEKKKNGTHKGAKILGITIQKNEDVKDVPIQDPYLPIDRCMDKIKKHIKNFSDIYTLLTFNLANYGEEYVNNKIQFVLDNFNSNIEEHIISAFKKREYKNPSFVITKKFKNLFDLHSEILAFIHKHNLTKISTYMFPVKLYSLKDKDSLLLEDKNFSVKITYNKNALSKVEFFINNK